MTDTPTGTTGGRADRRWPADCQFTLHNRTPALRLDEPMRLFAGTPFDQPPKCCQCGELEADCTCPSTPAEVLRIPPASQTAHLSLEKRRQGKIVTVIRGLKAEGNDLARLVTELKSQCGAGGTVKGDILEIQGNHLARVHEHLRRGGYRLKE